MPALCFTYLITQNVDSAPLSTIILYCTHNIGIKKSPTIVIAVVNNTFLPIRPNNSHYARSYYIGKLKTARNAFT